MSQPKYLAFDYRRQKWIEGEPARLLLIAQAEETIALIRSPKGPQYLRARGANETAAEAIALLQVQIEELRDVEDPAHV